LLGPTVGQIKNFTGGDKALLSIEADATVAQAAEKMSAHHIGCLVVLDNDGHFAGVISERDMLSKVLANSLSPNDILVKDIMTSSVISCDAQAPVTEAERLVVKNRIRHLPVVEGETAIGMISTRDLIDYRLHSNKARQLAAEQLAMLPTGLKSLEFEDVVSLAINEVPKTFHAERAVLCLKQENGKECMIYRNTCGHTPEHLLKTLNEEISESAQVNLSRTYCQCSKDKENLTRLLIPLSIHDQNGDTADESVIPGFLCMCWLEDSADGFDESQRYKATLLQQILNINLTNARLYKNYQDARRDSETDSLTGVGTRRVLEKVLKAECARSARYNRNFSVAIVDLDKFKEINDTAGHAAGDRALRQLAKLMRKNTRETDIIVARYGGDEFVLVMPETNVSGGKVLLERIRKQLKTISIPGVKHATISCGITEWNSSPPDNPETIMNRADDALYEAKRNGRNCVVSNEPVTTVV
jgi:diguanylate cyclase (GGDEF)-like protein